MRCQYIQGFSPRCTKLALRTPHVYIHSGRVRDRAAQPQTADSHSRGAGLQPSAINPGPRNAHPLTNDHTHRHNTDMPDGIMSGRKSAQTIAIWTSKLSIERLAASIDPQRLRHRAGIDLQCKVQAAEGQRLNGGSAQTASAPQTEGWGRQNGRRGHTLTTRPQ